MSQDIVLSNLAKFLDFDSPDRSTFPLPQKKSKERRNPQIATLLRANTIEPFLASPIHSKKQLKNTVTIDIEMRETMKRILNETGFCHGLSVVHAIMEKQNKLQWWESCLKLIADWDGKDESLNEEILLPQASQPTTKRAIFSRVLNYIAIAQVKANNIFEPFIIGGFNNQDQTKVFQAEFLPLALDSELRFYNEEFVIGNYDNATWQNIITQEMSKDHIVIIHMMDHAFRIGYIMNSRGEGEWIVYDPNYDHNSKSPSENIYQAFQSKQDMIAEMLRISGGALGLHIVNLNDKPLNLVTSQLEAKHIDENTLKIMAKFTPENISVLLDKRNESPELQKKLMSISCQSSDILFLSICTAQRFYDEILASIEFNHSLKAKFYETLLHANSHLGKTAFEFICSGLPLKGLLINSTENFKIRLLLLLRDNTIQLSELINHSSITNLKMLFEGLLSNHSNTEIASVNKLQTLLEILTQPGASGKTSWQLLHKKSPKLRDEMIHLFVDAINHMNSEEVYDLALQLAMKDKGILKGLCRERHLLRFSTFGETRTWQILMSACQKRLANIGKQPGWENFDTIINMKIHRSGFSGLFSKNIQLGNGDKDTESRNPSTKITR